MDSKGNRDHQLKWQRQIIIDEYMDSTSKQKSIKQNHKRNSFKRKTKELLKEKV